MQSCKQHYVDNQGLCHRCGKPLNFDYWLSSIGPEAYRNPDKYIEEWKMKQLTFKETVMQGAEHPGTPLEVLESPAGFYLGFRDEDGNPYSRETVYFGDRNSAEQVLGYMRNAKEFAPRQRKCTLL